MKVTVIGASGYSGGELLRILDNHPHFVVHGAIAHSQVGELIASVHPHLLHHASRRFDGLDSALIDQAELIFLALPHGESGRLISEHHELFSHKKVVDLGADFRLRSTASWERYYGGKHFGTWQYGLPELPGFRDEIIKNTKIANPGCYATAISLALAPFASISAEIDFADIVITAASGTTGAGRSAKVNLIGSEVMNSLSAYKVGGIHQHTPEIEEALAQLVKAEVALSFTPILAPMPRGILASVSIPVAGSSIQDIRSAFEDLYAKEQFVHVLGQGQWPQTNSVLGSNAVHLQVAFDAHVERAVVIAAIDNLGKGAASQAIQNANLISGIDEATGLSSTGVR